MEYTIETEAFSAGRSYPPSCELSQASGTGGSQKVCFLHGISKVSFSDARPASLQ
jgi:hypothetical protein